MTEDEVEAPSASVLTALSEVGVLRTVKLLAGLGPLTPSVLEKHVNMTAGSITRQLRKLRGLGLVDRDESGRRDHYAEWHALPVVLDVTAQLTGEDAVQRDAALRYLEASENAGHLIAMQFWARFDEFSSPLLELTTTWNQIIRRLTLADLDEMEKELIDFQRKWTQRSRVNEAAEARGSTEEMLPMFLGLTAVPLEPS